MNMIDSIKKDLGKARKRVADIDIEIAVLQKEKALVLEKIWELEYYAELHEKENSTAPKQRKKRTKKATTAQNEVSANDNR